jgi:hypothetical protein
MRRAAIRLTPNDAAVFGSTGLDTAGASRFFLRALQSALTAQRHMLIGINNDRQKKKETITHTTPHFIHIGNTIKRKRAKFVAIQSAVADFHSKV